MYKNYKRHRYLNNDKIRVDEFREECNSAVQADKEKYLSDLGQRLIDHKTNQKLYRKNINKLMNKSKR